MLVVKEGGKVCMPPVTHEQEEAKLCAVLACTETEARKLYMPEGKEDLHV